jgi:hypothetical protein
VSEVVRELGVDHLRIQPTPGFGVFEFRGLAAEMLREPLKLRDFEGMGEPVVEDRPLGATT